MASKNPEDIPLAPMQEKFVDEFLVDLNGTKAAIRAGYAKGSAARAAHRLRTLPHVKKAINDRRAEMAENTGIGPEYVLQRLVRTIEKCDDQDSYNATAVLRGLELLGRHLGMFVDRQEISGPDGEAISTKQVQDDATDFARSIVGLATRNRTRESAEGADAGDKGGIEV